MDPCHMLKLARNALNDVGEFVAENEIFIYRRQE